MKAKVIQKLVDSIPSSVRITKDSTYEVLFVDEFANEKLYGECRFDTKQIVLNKNQSKTLLLKTFLHECLHAIAMENDFDLSENQVLALEEGLFRFARLNGLLELKK